MIDPKNTKDVSNIRLDDLLEYMKTKSAEEITEFKNYANSIIPGSFGERKPCYFEIRNWVVSKYFPDIKKADTKPAVKMIDRIMAL